MSIFRKFLPFEYNFFELFDRQAALLVRAAESFQTLVHSSSYEPHADRIRAIEMEGDHLVALCDEMVNKTFITPIDREEILKLTSTLDDVIDLIDAAADCIVIYKVGPMRQSVRDMTDLLIRATTAVRALLIPLKKMKQTDEIRNLCVEIHRIENEVDLVFRAALGELFEQESDAKTIIKWKEVLENLEETADRCEDVADNVQRIILEFD